MIVVAMTDHQGVQVRHAQRSQGRHDGPFAGIEAIYQSADAERRAFILLEILAKPVSMHIDTGRLRKAG